MGLAFRTYSFDHYQLFIHRPNLLHQLSRPEIQVAKTEKFSSGIFDPKMPQKESQSIQFQNILGGSMPSHCTQSNHLTVLCCFWEIFIPGRYGAWTVINFCFQTAAKCSNQFRTGLGMRVPENQLADWTALVCIVTSNYPIIILNVDISSLVNNVIHCFDVGTFSCQVQESQLMGRKRYRCKPQINLMCKINWLIDWLTD